MPQRRAIATSHHLATEAGQYVFALGGNAVDAALSAAAVLTVVYPHNTSVGGDLIALISTGSNPATLVDAFGYAPKRVNAAPWGDSGRVSGNGPRSITLPGAVKGWKHLHDTYGTLPLAEILAPAINHSRQYLIGRSLRELIDVVAASTSQGCALMEKMFGSDYPTATHAANPALGRTLQQLADEGFDSFYTGGVSTNILAYLRSIRPDFNADDFSEYSVQVKAPLSMEFSGYRIHTSGAPSQGFQMLRFLTDIADSVGERTPHC